VGLCALLAGCYVERTGQRVTIAVSPDLSYVDMQPDGWRVFGASGVPWQVHDGEILTPRLSLRPCETPALGTAEAHETSLEAFASQTLSERWRLGGDAPRGGEVTLPVAPGIYCALALDLQAGLSADTGDATPPVFAADVTTPEGEAMHLVATRRSGADIALDPPLEVTSRRAPRLDVRLHVAAWWDRAPYDQGAAEHIVDTLPHAITIEQP
jgi:hypothetical protein